MQNENKACDIENFNGCSYYKHHTLTFC